MACGWWWRARRWGRREAARVVLVAVGCCGLGLYHSSRGGSCDGLDDQAHANTLHGSVYSLAGRSLEVDLSGPSWRPWKDDNASSPCGQFETRFGKGLPRVWLVSFPCSGNTWFRYLIEGATGIFTSSIHMEKALYKGGFLGEEEPVDTGRTLLQKIHGAIFHSEYRHDLLDRYRAVDPSLPAVLLLRHPARALICMWHLLHLTGTSRHTEEVSLSTFNTTRFRIYVEQATAMWEELATDRLLWSSGPLHVLHYEHLLLDPATHLRSFLHFLGIPVDEARLSCVTSHIAGSFKRKKTQDVDPFTLKEKARMENALSRVARLLTLRGFPPPTHPKD